MPVDSRLDNANRYNAPPDGAMERNDLGGLPVSQRNPSQTRGADSVHQNRVYLITTTAVANAVGLPRQQMGIACNTIRIDNLTGQWFFVPASQQWIAPYSLGWVLRIPKIEVAEILAITPTSMNSAPAAGETCTVIYEVTRFEPRPGVPYAFAWFTLG